MKRFLISLLLILTFSVASNAQVSICRVNSSAMYNRVNGKWKLASKQNYVTGAEVYVIYESKKLSSILIKKNGDTKFSFEILSHMGVPIKNNAQIKAKITSHRDLPATIKFKYGNGDDITLEVKTKDILMIWHMYSTTDLGYN